MKTKTMHIIAVWPRVSESSYAGSVEATRRPPVLLSMAHWYGTLAAVRELGRRGIEVCVASSMRFGQARWSRYAVRRLSCPDERDTARFSSWLLEQGSRDPGMALLRTSDD